MEIMRKFLVKQAAPNKSAIKFRIFEFECTSKFWHMCISHGKGLTTRIILEGLLNERSSIRLIIKAVI